MKFLASASEIGNELSKLLESCQSCQIAVAWATTKTQVYKQLFKAQDKIRRMIVGTHFYQTDPLFIENFIHHTQVRFVRDTDGVFHPKLYYFQLDDTAWSCLIGSSNFTYGGMVENEEAAVLLSHDDDVHQDVKEKLMLTMGRYWDSATSMTVGELDAYRHAWGRKRRLLKNLAGDFGPPDDDGSDNGQHPLNVEILQMSWRQYFDRVRSEKPTTYGHSMGARLAVMETVLQLFQEHFHFGDIPLEGRKKIGGLIKTEQQNFRLFGSMAVTKHFKAGIKSSGEQLNQISHALDAISKSGLVPRDDYLEYIRRLKAAFPDGGIGLATATRLLAMKRPDVFVCVDKKNTVELSKAFGIKLRSKHQYEAYWDSIIERIMQEAVWWSSAEPQDDIERMVWRARVAFLDSLFYSDDSGESGS